MILILLVVFFLSLLIIPKCKECWSNTYSGWPGPLENGSGRYNIPALYPNPKYSSSCKYKYNPNRNLRYIQMKDYPE